MIDRHLTEAELVGFVAGDLGARETLALERHVAVCSRCAARLQEAAFVEIAMHEVASVVAPRRRAPRRHSWLGTFPAPLALAASLVLGLGLPGRWLGANETTRGVIRGPATELASGGACDDDIDVGECTDPTMGDGALALMSMPADGYDPFEGDDGQLCEDVEGSALSCGG